MATTETPRKTIRIGVFIPADSQLLDMATVDLLASMSHEYLTMIAQIGDQVPAAIMALAPSVEIFYISTVQPGASIPLTASAHLKCTHHLSSPAVQPGQLDIVLVGGPDPTIDWTADENKKEAVAWLAAQAARPEVDILSICTGIFLSGAAGLLTEGRKACGPMGLQGVLRGLYPGVEWVGEEVRWARDGNFWSSGGVTDGNDLVSAYARLSGRFPRPVVELALMMADAGERPQKYGDAKPAVDLEKLLADPYARIFINPGKEED